MFDPRHVGSDFSRAAEQYDAHAALQQRVLASLIRKALPLLPGRARLLDAGCGTGQLARMLRGHDVTQIDIAMAMCRKAAQSGVATVNGAVESLPFADGVFDGVLSSLVLQWVPDEKKAMEEMRRVLKPGGVLAVATFGAATLNELRESFAAADRYSHVSSFITGEEWEHAEVVTEYYPDVMALMRYLKAIGARNKRLERRKSLMTPRQMSRVGRYYGERFGTARGLPATWEILYAVSRKS
jgi:malonyl-CoA O-methyltransferase